MGRPEPCILFAQTFVHPQLDEYVDEVIFAEPIVITACEFLEQGATSISPTITLLGATSPPSFALEVFVQCEGETRFRRLCQPFLYSHSSSNVLEVEAVVTNHLVVRGSYRSLSLVIYGNTAEDLGQFNIEFDLDSSLSNLVCSTEAKLEDLPPALYLNDQAIEVSVSPPNALSLPAAASDISVEMKQLLQLMFKILELSNLGDAIYKVVSNVVSAASAYVTCDLHCTAVFQKQFLQGRSQGLEEVSHHVLSDARKELLDLYNILHDESRNVSAEVLADCTFQETEADLVTSQELMEFFSRYIHFHEDSSNFRHFNISQSKNVILGLSVALLLCSGRESCYHFVNGGGMEQLACVFSSSLQNSAAITLMLLGVVEQATRHSIGCEGFLGWWPREDENVPSGVSEGYSQLLKLLLQRQRHDVASLATYVLHRLRFYEVVSRYECAVLSVLEGLSVDGKVTRDTLNMLINAKLQLKRLLNLINSRGTVEDPSPVVCASRSFILGQTEGFLSYKATGSLIASSDCCFSSCDIDTRLLSLLKERGFLPLSAALLASSVLRSGVGHAMDLFVDIALSIEAIILSLLFCRSGLVFLLFHPELSATLILALQGADYINKEECVPPRYASILMSKGFFCHPQEVGMIVQMHLRVVNAIDRLITSNPQSEEFLWVLWELCGLSRSECGRQALLSLEHFPEAVSLLIEALHSGKELEPVALNSGSSPLNLAIFHSAAEIFEVIVTDSTASSLGTWIGHAMELHKALHSSSPGSSRKDTPTRLLEWIDAGVVYHKNGANGLLRYAAVLASGGDAHLTSASILASDSMDVENDVGDPSSGSDIHVLENLGKIISEKSFDGVTLRDSSVAELTTAFRILAFISENSAVAAALYDEGAITVIHAVIVNCRFMLERSSNNYDYLVDEGAEGNATSDLLLERNREQSLVDLLIPSLVLLITFLQKLQEANEQHRNTKLMNALLRLHREVSPKLAACAADMSSPYPGPALGFGTVCHLLVSALACWPIYGWTPGLFHSLFASIHATSLLSSGPKETCSFLCLLNDLLPEEGIWLWKNGMPLLSAFRTLAIGSLLGPQKERQVNWYLQHGHLEVLLSQLVPQLEKIAQIILHYATTSLVVVQDMLRVFIVRLACQEADKASLLLRPLILCIHDHLSESSYPSDTDAFKVYRLLDFIASLLEHPHAKPLLLKEGAVQMLAKVLVEICSDPSNSDEKQFSDNRNSVTCEFTQFSWALPVFKSLSLICESQSSLHLGRSDKHKHGHLSTEDCSLILPFLLRLCQVLPVGKDLLACLTVLKDLGSCNEGQSALLTIFSHISSSKVEELDSNGTNERDGNCNFFGEYEWKKHPPLLDCWRKLLTSINSSDSLLSYAIETVGTLSLAALRFCMDGKSLNMNRIIILKYLFGLPPDIGETDGFPEENINYLQDMTTLLSSKMTDDDYSYTLDLNTLLYQVSESAKSLLLLLQKPSGSVNVDDIISSEVVPLYLSYPFASNIHQITNVSAEKIGDYSLLGAFGDKFLWECPETLPDRLSQAAAPAKRKMSSMEGPGRRARGDNSSTETIPQNAFSRGLGLPTTPVAPTRRDAFRQRKPNTSRPPSMHVDDYVARERNVDGATSSNVIQVQRVGSTGGRPPSIHVDEFMARQRERQNSVAVAVGEAATPVKNAPPENNTDREKFNKSKQLKADLDDDLQGIDIVFDDEESESDDKLPFPQPDDNLRQPAPVTEQSSPHSIVEETGSDINDSQFSRMGTPLAFFDENTQFSSRMSALHAEKTFARESSVSSDKKYFEKPDELRNVIPVKTSSGFDSAGAINSSGFPNTLYMNASTSSLSLQPPVDSRAPPTSNIYSKNGSQQTGHVPLVAGSQGLYDQKFLLHQPPLPPMPPPPTISPVISQTPDPVPSQSSPFVNSVTDVQPLLPTAFNIQSEYVSAYNHISTSLASSLPMPDSKYTRTPISSPSGSARPPLPPLPPTPPPFLSTPFTSPSLKTSIVPSSMYTPASVVTTEIPQTSTLPLSDARLGNLAASGARLATYPSPPLIPPLVFGRPTSIPLNVYGSTPTQQQGENLTSILHNLPIPQPSIQSIQPVAHLQPLQPPQLPRPPQPPQHLRPPIQVSQQIEQGLSLLQSPVQMQLQPLQMLQQPHVSPIQVYYQAQQSDNFLHGQHQQQVEHSQPQAVHQQGDGASQLQQDSGMSLQDYFSSPEAIQSLLSDREKLCQLLEQHPKLMQMLQERLGQL